MNPETEQNINQAIDWLQKTGGSIQDFAVEQAPLYCREVVQWELWSGLAAAVGGAILLVAALFSLRWCYRRLQKDEMALFPVFLAIGSAAAIVLGACGLVSGGQGAIKAAVAPRLIIVEHLRRLK